MNPFKYGCVVGGENFCPRPQLQRHLRELLKSGQNVVVQGPRRMGKTSLVCETVGSMRGVKLLYVDLFCVRTIGEFCRRVVVAASKCGKGRSFLDRLAALVKGLRPVFSVDRDTGAPTITVDVKAAKDESSADEVMNMIAKMAKGNRLCVVFDEFQDILDLPDADAIVACLRAKIQFLADTPFVFLGSIRNAMHTIFNSPKSPFFKSAVNYGVDSINRKDFCEFLVSRFAAGNRRLSRDIADLIIERAAEVSGDVQELAETTWLETREGQQIGIEDVERGMQTVFAREHRSFAAMKSRLTTVQLSVLYGLAKDENAKVFSSDFLESNGIRNVGSISKALKRLQEDEYIFEFEGEYRFENPFFRAWLQEAMK